MRRARGCARRRGRRHRPRCWSAMAATRSGRQSLAAALMAEAGLEPPPGAPPGYGGYVPLEKLLDAAPGRDRGDVEPARAAGRAGRGLSHASGAARRSIRRSAASCCRARYTLCGGPSLVAAFDYLTERDALAAAALELRRPFARRCATSASSPSVSAAGPGCRISGDLISRSKPSRTAGIASKPGRAATFAGHEFLAAP